MLEKRLRASERERAGGQPSERARTKAAVSQSQLQLQRANTTSAAPYLVVRSWVARGRSVGRQLVGSSSCNSSIHPDTVRGSLSLRSPFGPFVNGNLNLDLCPERAYPRWSE